MAGFGLHVTITNDGIRAVVVERLNANSEYRRLFADIFNDVRFSSARKYNRAQAGVDNDLQVGPIEPVLQRIDPLLATPVTLTSNEFQWLLDFVRDGLHDPDATPERLRELIPERLPSGRLMHIFE